MCIRDRVKFGGRTRVGGRNTDSRVTLLAEALNHLRSSHVFGMVFGFGSLVGRVEKGDDGGRRFGRLRVDVRLDRPRARIFECGRRSAALV